MNEATRNTAREERHRSADRRATLQCGPRVRRRSAAQEPAALSLAGFALSKLSRKRLLTCKHDAAAFAPSLALLIAYPNIIP